MCASGQRRMIRSQQNQAFGWHQPRGFWPQPASLSPVCSAQPPWKRQQSDIGGHSTRTRGCCPPHPPTPPQGCVGMILLFILCFAVSFPSLCLCSWSVGGFQQLSCQWYYWHLNFFPLMFLLSCTFGDLSIVPGLPPFPVSITATVLGHWESSPWLLPFCTGQLGITCFSSLLFLSPAQSQLSVRSAAFPADVCLVYLAVNRLSASHMGTEDMEIIYFRHSDITRDRSWQRMYRQIFNHLF